MSRTARKKSSAGIYHIMMRGLNKQNIFEEDKDKDKFLQILKKYKEKMNFNIYAYCLMNNHVHLLIKENDYNISEIMHNLGTYYAGWYNKKYERCGSLFEGRFKSSEVEDMYYLKDLIRYIHQNPVKAGLVKELSDYKWSSYSEYLYKAESVDTTLLFKYIEKDNFTEYSKEQKSKYEDDKNERSFEFINCRKLCDEDAYDIFKHLSGLENINHIQRLDKKDRDRIIKLAREEGLSIRQIARLTGLGIGVIQK